MIKECQQELLLELFYLVLVFCWVSWDAEVLEFCAILHDVSWGGAIEIALADGQWRHAEFSCGAQQDGFDDDKSLRATESTISRI